MKKTIYFLLITIIVLAVQSCSSTYYPSHANVSLFKAKNEMKASLGVSPSSANIDLSYSVTDNFLVTAGAFGYMQKESSISNTTYKATRGYSFTIAPGFYTHFGNGVFETLVGYGYNYSDARDTEGNYHKFYIQPTIGTNNDYFELAFTPRLTTVFIDKNTFLDKRPSQFDMFIEPIGTIRAGGKNFKVTTQLGFTIPTANINYPINPVYWTFGIQYHLRNNKASEWPQDSDF